MPFQNRVTPFGDIVFSPQRGAFTGNRGVLHNEQKQIVRPFRLKAWITCTLTYKNQRREIMQADRWTQLFFLDEATAFAAGHRPCAFCRYPAFKLFKTLWWAANAEREGLTDDKITSVDAVLHRERMDEKGQKRGFWAQLTDLPAGVFVCREPLTKEAHLWFAGQCWLWTDAGYLPADGFSEHARVWVLTPASIVRVLAAGYPVGVHPSAAKIGI